MKYLGHKKFVNKRLHTNHFCDFSSDLFVDYTDKMTMIVFEHYITNVKLLELIIVFG